MCNAFNNLMDHYNFHERGIAFETAHNVATCRLVLYLMAQTSLAVRKRLEAQRAPVDIPAAIGAAGSAIYLTK